jgi:hypothetical protein
MQIGNYFTWHLENFMHYMKMVLSISVYDELIGTIQPEIL